MENKKVQTDVLLPVAMLALFSTVCAYGALASLVNVVFSQRLLPMGPSMFQVGISRTNQSVSEIQCFSLPHSHAFQVLSRCGLILENEKKETSPEPPCPVADSRLTSGLLKIAGLLEQGRVCGIPTDTVYALAASCKNPQAIEKIYNIKVRTRNRSEPPAFGETHPPVVFFG